MKTLKQTLCPPPKLDQIQLSSLAMAIRDRLKVIDDGRQARLDKLEEYRKMHRDDYGFRNQPKTIYALSNIGVPVIKGVATSYASKFEDELYITENSIQVKAQNSEDEDESEQFDKYWKFELIKEIGIQESLSQALNVVSVEGTAITKRSWKSRKSYYNRTETQLHDAQGNVVLHPNTNEPITPELPTYLSKPFGILKHFVAPRTHFSLGQDQNGNHIEGPELTPEHTWKVMRIKDSVTHYDNADSKVIPFDDFRCLLTAGEIEDSPILGHDYDKKIYEINEMVASSLGGLADDNGQISEEGWAQTGWRQENLGKLYSLPDAAAKIDTTAIGAQGREKSTKAVQPIVSLGESTAYTPYGVRTADESMKTLRFTECYLKYDIDNDGVLEDVICIYERDAEIVIFCDYHVNIFADCEAPFVVHGLFRIPGRWYSMGPYEYLSIAQDFIDRTFNRMNYRQSLAANPITWIKKSNFLFPPKEISPGLMLKLKDAYTIQQSMGFIEMPALEQVEWKHFEFFISIVQLATGVSAASQGDISSLPSTATATGTHSIIEEGNKLYRMFIRRLQESAEKHLEGMVRLIQQNLDQKRVFRYNKGFDQVTAVITPEQIRDLDFDVSIVLSKSAMQQKAQGIQSSLGVIQSWIQMPAAYQARLRAIFVQLLNIMGITEADAILPTMEEIQKDQSSDDALSAIAAKVAESGQKLAQSGMPLDKVVSADLLALLPQLQQIIGKPPPAPEAEGAAEQPAQEQAPQAPQGMPVAPAGPMPGASQPTAPLPPEANAIQ